MRKFNLEQSQTNEITSHSGLTLIGAIIEQHTSASKTIDKKLPKRHGVPASDHVKTYFGLLAQAKNDFCAVNNVCHDRFFRQSMNIKKKYHRNQVCVSVLKKTQNNSFQLSMTSLWNT